MARQVGATRRRDKQNVKPQPEEFYHPASLRSSVVAPSYAGQDAATGGLRRFTRWKRQSGPPGIQPQPPNTRTTRTVIIHGTKAECCRGNWRLMDENAGGRRNSGATVQKLSHQIDGESKTEPFSKRALRKIRNWRGRRNALKSRQGCQ